jgi:hypothetical protein
MEKNDFAESHPSELIESFALNLLELLLIRGVVDRDEASTLIANLKAEISAPPPGREGIAHEVFAEGLAGVTQRLRLMKPN